MAKCKVHDKKVSVEITRNGDRKTVRFCDLLEGDIIATGSHAGVIVSEAAHASGDATYDGWLFYDGNDNDFYPEDFGAEEIDT